MTDDASILARYGAKWPAWEYEMDAEHRRTGRRRKKQVVSWDRKPNIARGFT